MTYNTISLVNSADRLFSYATFSPTTPMTSSPKSQLIKQILHGSIGEIWHSTPLGTDEETVYLREGNYTIFSL